MAVSDFRQLLRGGTGRIGGVLVDEEQAYRAVSSRDSRFDGWFVTAVRTTGIYCRPSCPAVTPQRRNVEFYPTTAAAQGAGYRACRRCLPDAVPGSPEWNLRADLAGRGMRLISDGLVEREGVPGLARRLGYSDRHVTRVLTAELGAGPLALARAHRAHAARTLIETTALPFGDIAFATGFASIRQFNDTVRAVFASTPSGLRSTSRAPRTAPGLLTLRLPYRAPFDAAGLLEYLAARAIPGVEYGDGTRFARSLRLAHGPATVELTAGPGHVVATLRLTELRDLGSAVSRVRRLLDLDADPLAVDEVLGADPVLGPSVAKVPGIRLPGSVDGAETLVRALFGQQISVVAARTALGRLSTALGDPLPDALVTDGLTRLFPSAQAIASRGAEILRGPVRRTATVLGVAEALTSGDLEVHVGRDPVELRSQLEAMRGVGPWTAGYVLMRVLGAPDELLTSDLALRRGAVALGLPGEPGRLAERGKTWGPWRSYAGVHLWRASMTSKGDSE